MKKKSVLFEGTLLHTCNGPVKIFNKLFMFLLLAPGYRQNKVLGGMLNVAYDNRERAVGAQQIIERALSNAGKKGISFETYGFGKETAMSPFENNSPEERFYSRTVIIDIISAK